MCQKMKNEDKKEMKEKDCQPQANPKKSFEALKAAVEGRDSRFTVYEVPEDKKEKYAALIKKWKDSGLIVDDSSGLIL